MLKSSDGEGEVDFVKWFEIMREQQNVSEAVYLEKIVWPSVALRKLVEAEVKVTEEDLKKMVKFKLSVKGSDVSKDVKGKEIGKAIPPFTHHFKYIVSTMVYCCNFGTT